MIEDFTLTESTTRDELIERINDLDEEIQKLETKIEDQKLEIAELSVAPMQKERLVEAADLMADLGRIHNTPKAKLDWACGLD